MRPRDLGDVIVRARGLARHLLDAGRLRQLASVSGSGALAHALQDAGYWPAPAGGGPALSTAHLVERCIDHEIVTRLAVLARWLAERARAFAPLFELEERDLLRIRLRRLLAGEAEGATPLAPPPSGWPALRVLQSANAAARDVPALVRALDRIGHAYAPSLKAALRAQGEELSALERALDAAWAARASDAVRRGDPALAGWVEDEIDLQNAWAALAGDADAHLAGGRHLSSERHRTIAAAPEAPERRRTLARVFRGGSLTEVFEDSEADLAALESRTRAVRIAAARQAARREPLGASPVVEVVLRLQAERADLRCIAWGIASGLDSQTITGRLVATG